MIITFTTDFGTADYFVGAMKGAALSVDPLAVLVDITHEIPAHDIRAGAYTLAAAYGTFPPGTIHVAVVDPGVGSARRPIAVRAGQYSFIGPDNGLFSFVFDREPDHRVFHLTERKHFRESVSSTFHGRDIFAPVAGALSTRVAIEELGPEISDPVRLVFPPVANGSDGSITGAIIHIDRFGNCVINVRREDVGQLDENSYIEIDAGGRRIRSLLYNYADASGGDPFAIWGSAGYLEISVREGSAARALELKPGDRLTVRSNRK